jgi:malonate-semialdehyde dehydrogenase (acetylating)/methylmalonate-semialdehyde dehydrogenase
VLSIVRARTVDEAIAIENANPYGNAASIFTTSGAVARHCIERFEAGMCGVNVGVPVPREPFGFGGWNDSLFGQGDLTGYDGFASGPARARSPPAGRSAKTPPGCPDGTAMNDRQ